MIDFVPFLTILPVFILALAVPGPDFVFISATALARGRGAGLWGAAGIAAGILFYAAASLWGLGLLFDRMHGLAVAVKIAGGLYLIYMGVKLWQASFAKEDADVTAADGVPAADSHPFRQGLLTNLTNPKAIAFFSSIFAIVLTPDVSGATRVLTSVSCAITAFAWFGFVAMALSAPSVRGYYWRARKGIDRAAGTIMLLFGARLVADGV